MTEMKSNPRTEYNDIKVAGAPVGYDSNTGLVTIAGDEVDGVQVVELGNRVNKALVRDGFIKTSGGKASFVGTRLNALEIDSVNRDIKFKGVEAWLNDHFAGDAVKLAEALAILDNAKERISAL